MNNKISDIVHRSKSYCKCAPEINESILSIEKVTLRFRGMSGHLVPKM